MAPEPNTSKTSPASDSGARASEEIAPTFTTLSSDLSMSGILKQAEEALRESEARFSQLADAIPNIVWVARANGAPEYLNKQWRDFTGVDASSSSGDALNRLIHPDDLARVMAAWTAAMETKQLWETEYRLRRADGSYCWHLGRSQPVVDEAGNVTMWIGAATDIEGRKTVEQALHQANLRTAGILESITDPFFTLDHQWRFTYINAQAAHLLFRTREELLGQGMWEEFPEAVGGSFYHFYHKAVNERVPLSVEDYYAPLDAWMNVRAFPSESGLAVFFQNVNERKRAEEERERLLAEAEKRAARETLLNRISEAIRTTTAPEKIQQVAVSALGEALHADRCYFSQFDLAADLNWVGQDFHRADLPSLAGRYRISDFQVKPEDYYPNERTLVVADVMAEQWSFPEVLMTALRQLRLRSAMTVPIFDGGRLVATLSVAMADEPRAWTEDEVQLLEAVAAQTRSAVETAHLRAEQQEHLQEEALIGRIGVAIRSELDPDAIQEQAAALVGEALSVSRCFYLTYDASRDAAHAGRDYHRDDLPSLAGDYRLSDFTEMLAELFAGEGTAVLTDVHITLSPTVAEGMLSSQNRALLAVPFFDGGRLVAALWASMDEPRIWTAHEVALIEQAATLTRTALETARVSRKERAIAHQLQEALQPTVPEHIPGLSLGSFTRPALDEASIGGDFIDVFVLDKEQYAIVIGDVSGKGLAAAQQLALIRNTLRAMLYLYRAPAQAAAALNDIVTAHDLLIGFVTAWIGVYDLYSGQIIFCSCGHEPALVRRLDGTVEALETMCPPLGVAENAQYRDRVVKLEPGDALLLYTDGISEAGPSRRELLGTNGLIRILTTLPADADVQSQAEILVAEASDFAKGALRDDVAVLLARRQ
jgi:PAS domain S-box-containing protein